jgi:hypothetical protein
MRDVGCAHVACRASAATALRKAGAGKRNRTSDLLITNQLLYRLSYSGAGARSIGAGYEPIKNTGAGMFLL